MHSFIFLFHPFHLINIIEQRKPTCVHVMYQLVLCSVLNIFSCFHVQRYLALDDRVAWAYYQFPSDMFSGETVEEWVALSGKQGEGQEGNINIILSFTVRTVAQITLYTIFLHMYV